MKNSLLLLHTILKSNLTKDLHTLYNTGKSKYLTLVLDKYSKSLLKILKDNNATPEERQEAITDYKNTLNSLNNDLPYIYSDVFQDAKSKQSEYICGEKKYKVTSIFALRYSRYLYAMKSNPIFKDLFILNGAHEHSISSQGLTQLRDKILEERQNENNKNQTNNEINNNVKDVDNSNDNPINEEGIKNLPKLK